MKAGYEKRIQRVFQSVSKQVSEVRKGGKGAVGIILGSGLGAFVDQVEGTPLAYGRIEGFPQTTVQGHQGLLKCGEGIFVMAGRFHTYEGWDLDDVVLPVFLLHRLGVETLIVTNAAGAVNTQFAPGQLVLIRDHLNLMGRNPLVGPVFSDLGPRFPDMTSAYSQELRRIAKKAWPEDLEEGIYAALLGPSYETPAEIRMLSLLGADMVGMSTVPEVIAANFLGMDVLGISCITNMAAGILDSALSHEEVIETGRKAASVFAHLLRSILERLGRG